MSHSNSSLNCFAACMKKYEHNYVLHTPPCKPTSPHLTFGTMAHDVLHKAGMLRDEVEDGVVDTGKFYSIIPSEAQYSDLQEFFGIKNWTTYFTNVIKQTAIYEKQLIKEISELDDGPISIEREQKVQLTVDQIHEILGESRITQPIVGIIDCLIYTKNYAIIVDYKFSSTRKTQDDFDMNSQLPLYALFVHLLYDIPLKNIKVGYIDIPKKDFDKPIILSNGTLSRSKSQNVSPEAYERLVNAIHGRWYFKHPDGTLSQVEFDPTSEQICEPDDYYNCKPGGYYYDCYCALALNRAAYLSVQYLDLSTYKGVISDLLDAATLIDYMTANSLPFVAKYDAYTCKGCEFLKACKPWLGVDYE